GKQRKDFIHEFSRIKINIKCQNKKNILNIEQGLIPKQVRERLISDFQPLLKSLISVPCS
ncbi:MAG: hypothetical protein V3U02_04655, partial [Calditrichia bacterium]